MHNPGLMMRFIYKYRFFFIGVVFSVIGMLMLYSALQYKGKVIYQSLLYKQLIWTLISWCVFWIIASIDYHYWKGIAVPFYLFSIILLVLVLIVGDVRYGAQRWLNLGGFIFQPSEFAKISFVIGVSYILSIPRRFSWGWTLVGVAMAFLPMLLILKEPDLGTALVFFPILTAALFVFGLNLRWIISAIVAGLAIMPFAWHFLKDYQKKRLLVFLNPDLDPLGAGYTITQSRIAIGSGGIWGKGWLSGTQNKLNFLPERHTDFIFSVLAEEWGFIGAAGIILLFLLLIVMGLELAFRAKDRFATLLAVSIVVYFFFHSFINIAMTSGFVPVVGLPLPFISYGGTSLVISYFALGLLQSIANSIDKGL